jgi:hypothetical protein
MAKAASPALKISWSSVPVTLVLMRPSSTQRLKELAAASDPSLSSPTSVGS